MGEETVVDIEEVAVAVVEMTETTETLVEVDMTDKIVEVTEA
jgi:hypothetical protein